MKKISKIFKEWCKIIIAILTVFFIGGCFMIFKRDEILEDIASRKPKNLKAEKNMFGFCTLCLLATNVFLWYLVVEKFIS